MSLEDESLFSDAERPDLGPPPYSLSAYRVLDRGHQPISAEVRRKLDEWYRRLPPSARRSIHERFASDDDSAHLGAFFELYLHEFFSRLGAVDFDVGKEDQHHRRPDLAVEIEGSRTYVEATALMGDDIHSPTRKRHLDQVHDAINQVRAPGFFVDVDIDSEGTTTPSRRAIVGQAQRWLDALDPDELLRQGPDQESEVTHSVTTADWAITLTAFPIRPEHRDYPHHRVIGSRFFGGGGLDDITPLRRKLKKKAAHYGMMDRPFIVATLCAGTFVEDYDIVGALLGPTIPYIDPGTREMTMSRVPDGVLLAPDGRPVNRRVSGVLTAVSLTPSTVGVIEPRLWINPWAQNPLDSRFPWHRMELQIDGRVVEHQATRSVREVLGLPARWPYP